MHVWWCECVAGRVRMSLELHLCVQKRKENPFLQFSEPLPHCLHLISIPSSSFDTLQHQAKCAALSVYSTDQLFSSPKALILPLRTMFTCSGSSAQDTAEMGGGWVRSWWKPIDPAPCIPRTGRKLLVQLNKTLPTGSKQVTRVLMFLQELPTGNICDFWYMSFYTN